MEMFVVGAYLQLVEGCDSVTYHSELPNPKEFWVEVVGRNEAQQCMYYVDFAEKFDWYPPDMRPDTMVKKLVRRYVQIWGDGLAHEYDPDGVHCQLWLPRPPARRVAEALPKVVERLREQHRIRLELIEPAEVAARIPVVVECIRKQSFCYDNLFIRAVLLADARLDYQAGAPMSEEHIEAVYRFPGRLRSAADAPGFVHQLLTSRRIVHWLAFESPSFDDLRLALREMEPDDALGELLEELEERGEAEEALDAESQEFMPRRYSAQELAYLTQLVLDNIEALRAEEVGGDMASRPQWIEIDFMLPYLSRAQDLIEPSVIEREVLRYGGDRDEMLAHFAEQHPDKLPYRAILRIELYEPGGQRLPAYSGGKAMDVPIDDPAVTDNVHMAISINYATHFTGYVVLMMRRLAASLDL